MQRAPLQLEDEPADAALVVRIGAVVGSGVLVAIVASLPAALRILMTDIRVNVLAYWLALAAVMTVPGMALVMIARRARVGMKLLAGDRVTVILAGLFWWCVLELGLLAVFGGVLRAKTHHHGLAGVTFATFAIVSGATMAILAIRSARLLARFDAKTQKQALLVVAGAALLAVLVVAMRTSRAPALSTAGGIFDVFSFVTMSAVLSSTAIVRVKPITIGGAPAALFVLVLGLSTVIAEAPIRHAIMTRAPIHGIFLGTVVSSPAADPSQSSPAPTPEPP